MSSELPDKEILDKIRETLDRNTDDLDEKTVLSLKRIRLDALESAGQRQRLFAFPRLITAGGFATLAVVAAAVSIWSFSARQRLPVSLPEDVEVLVVKDHFDLYEDLDFYRWLNVAESKGNGR
jgi:hypothetical protein